MLEIYQRMGVPTVKDVAATADQPARVEMNRIALLSKVAEIAARLRDAHGDVTRAQMIWALVEALPANEIRVSAQEVSVDVVLI